MLFTRAHISNDLSVVLPLYLLVIVGEESIVDYITGYKNILICKMGKINIFYKK